MEIRDKKYNIGIIILKEMQLNYKNQYPKEIPDMNLVSKIVLNDIIILLLSKMNKNKKEDK